MLVFGYATGQCNLASTKAALPEGTPLLDDLAGDWIPMKDVANPPAVHNCNQMLIVDRDLTLFFCNPGQLYQWQHGSPVVELSVDGREYPAIETRCYAYRALRRNRERNRRSVETDTRMVNEERGVLSNTAANPIRKLFETTLYMRRKALPACSIAPRYEMCGIPET